MADTTNSNGVRAPDDSDTNTARQGKVKRGKTRDAFAFRDFDEDRILRRKFFTDKFDFEKDFGIIADFSNKDFFATFRYAGQNVEWRRCKLKELAVISDTDSCALWDYQEKILRHAFRITSFLDVLADIIANSDEQLESRRRQYQRAKDLFERYWEFSRSVHKFRTELVEAYRTFNIVIKRAYRENFSARLKEARRRKNNTQQQLANELEITVGAYQFYERGQREPSLTNLIRLAKILDVTPNWLLGFE